MNRKNADTARRLGPSPWRDDWMPATKETHMDADPLRSELVALAARLLHLRSFQPDDPHDEELRRVAVRLRELADGAAPRASQAATATHSTGDDAGAAHDPHGAAAGHTEAPLYLVETSHCGKWRHGSEFEDLAEARDYAEYCHATYGDTRIVRVTREVVDQ